MAAQVWAATTHIFQMVAVVVSYGSRHWASASDRVAQFWRLFAVSPLTYSKWPLSVSYRRAAYCFVHARPISPVTVPGDSYRHWQRRFVVRYHHSHIPNGSRCLYHICRAAYCFVHARPHIASDCGWSSTKGTAIGIGYAGLWTAITTHIFQVIAVVCITRRAAYCFVHARPHIASDCGWSSTKGTAVGIGYTGLSSAITIFKIFQMVAICCITRRAAYCFVHARPHIASDCGWSSTKGTAIGIGNAGLGTRLAFDMVAVITFICIAVFGVMCAAGRAIRNRIPIRTAVGIGYTGLGALLTLRVVAVFARGTVFLVFFCGCASGSRSVGAGVVATTASSVCSVTTVISVRSISFVTREGQQEGC